MNCYHKLVPFRVHIRKIHVIWSYYIRQKLYDEVESELVHFLARIREVDKSHRYLKKIFRFFIQKMKNFPTLQLTNFDRNARLESVLHIVSYEIEKQEKSLS